MYYLGKFESIGDAWLAVLETIYTLGEEIVTSDETYMEYKGLSIDVFVPESKDEILERYADKDAINWMTENFENFKNVSELKYARSYASRLYRYAGTKDQVEWVINKLKKNPLARSATITTFEPLTDNNYIPCISLLDFDMKDDILNVYVYARALDFGEKAYANLICISKLLHNISEQLTRKCGMIHLICKSVHVYKDSYAKTKYMLGKEGIKV